MKYRQCIAACSLFMLSFSPSLSFATPTVKESAKIQWEVEKSWTLPVTPIDIVYSLDGSRVFILTSDSNVLVYDANGERLGEIPVNKGVSSIDIAPRGEKLYLIDQDAKTFTDLAISFFTEINTAGSPFLGKTDAPVTIAVFTDFECPHCAKAVLLLEQVLENNPDTVKIVLKNMPLNFHKFAAPAALAALAAERQGKFWEFHDELFALPRLSNEAIDAIAVKLQLNMDTFKKDIASSEVREKLAKDLMEAQKAGVTGTPTIFINGIKLKTRTLPAIQKLIDEQLSASR